jgi:hypothetical protein
MSFNAGVNFMAVKTINPNMGRPVGNKFKVGSSTWGGWSNAAKRTFNLTYAGLRSQSIMAHPKAAPMPKGHWDTIRWNAAYVAACAVDGRAS